MPKLYDDTEREGQPLDNSPLQVNANRERAMRRRDLMDSMRISLMPKGEREEAQDNIDAGFNIDGTDRDPIPDIDEETGLPYVPVDNGGDKVFYPETQEQIEKVLEMRGARFRLPAWTEGTDFEEALQQGGIAHKWEDVPHSRTGSFYRKFTNHMWRNASAAMEGFETTFGGDPNRQTAIQEWMDGNIDPENPRYDSLSTPASLAGEMAYNLGEIAVGIGAAGLAVGTVGVGGALMATAASIATFAPRAFGHNLKKYREMGYDEDEVLSMALTQTAQEVGIEGVGNFPIIKGASAMFPGLLRSATKRADYAYEQSIRKAFRNDEKIQAAWLAETANLARGQRINESLVRIGKALKQKPAGTLDDYVKIKESLLKTTRPAMKHLRNIGFAAGTEGTEEVFQEIFGAELDKHWGVPGAESAGLEEVLQAFGTGAVVGGGVGGVLTGVGAAVGRRRDAKMDIIRELMEDAEKAQEEGKKGKKGEQPEGEQPDTPPQEGDDTINIGGALDEGVSSVLNLAQEQRETPAGQPVVVPGEDDEGAELSPQEVVDTFIGRVDEQYKDITLREIAAILSNRLASEEEVAEVGAVIGSILDDENLAPITPNEGETGEAFLRRLTARRLGEMARDRLQPAVGLFRKLQRTKEGSKNHKKLVAELQKMENGMLMAVLGAVNNKVAEGEIGSKDVGRLALMEEWQRRREEEEADGEPDDDGDTGEGEGETAEQELLRKAAPAIALAEEIEKDLNNREVAHKVRELSDEAVYAYDSLPDDMFSGGSDIIKEAVRRRGKHSSYKEFLSIVVDFSEEVLSPAQTPKILKDYLVEMLGYIRTKNVVLPDFILEAWASLFGDHEALLDTIIEERDGFDFTSNEVSSLFLPFLKMWQSVMEFENSQGRGKTSKLYKAKEQKVKEAIKRLEQGDTEPETTPDDDVQPATLLNDQERATINAAIGSDNRSTIGKSTKILREAIIRYATQHGGWEIAKTETLRKETTYDTFLKRGKDIIHIGTRKRQHISRAEPIANPDEGLLVSKHFFPLNDEKILSLFEEAVVRGETPPQETPPQETPPPEEPPETTPEEPQDTSPTTLEQVKDATALWDTADKTLKEQRKIEGVTQEALAPYRQGEQRAIDRFNNVLGRLSDEGKGALVAEQVPDKVKDALDTYADSKQGRDDTRKMARALRDYFSDVGRAEGDERGRKKGQKKGDKETDTPLPPEPEVIKDGADALRKLGVIDADAVVEELRAEGLGQMAYLFQRMTVFDPTIVEKRNTSNMIDALMGQLGLYQGHTRDGRYWWWDNQVLPKRLIEMMRVRFTDTKKMSMKKAAEDIVAYGKEGEPEIDTVTAVVNQWKAEYRFIIDLLKKYKTIRALRDAFPKGSDGQQLIGQQVDAFRESLGEEYRGGGIGIGTGLGILRNHLNARYPDELLEILEPLMEANPNLVPPEVKISIGRGGSLPEDLRSTPPSEWPDFLEKPHSLEGNNTAERQKSLAEFWGLGRVTFSGTKHVSDKSADIITNLLHEALWLLSETLSWNGKPKVDDNGQPVLDRNGQPVNNPPRQAVVPMMDGRPLDILFGVLGRGAKDKGVAAFYRPDIHAINVIFSSLYSPTNEPMMVMTGTLVHEMMHAISRAIEGQAMKPTDDGAQANGGRALMLRDAARHMLQKEIDLQQTIGRILRVGDSAPQELRTFGWAMNKALMSKKQRDEAFNDVRDSTALTLNKKQQQERHQSLNYITPAELDFLFPRPEPHTQEEADAVNNQSEQEAAAMKIRVQKTAQDALFFHDLRVNDNEKFSFQSSFDGLTYGSYLVFDDTTYTERSKLRDKMEKRRYWSTAEEMMARAKETHMALIYKDMKIDHDLSVDPDHAIGLYARNSGLVVENHAYLTHHEMYWGGMTDVISMLHNRLVYDPDTGAWDALLEEEFLPEGETSDLTNLWKSIFSENPPEQAEEGELAARQGFGGRRVATPPAGGTPQTAPPKAPPPKTPTVKPPDEPTPPPPTSGGGGVYIPPIEEIKKEAKKGGPTITNKQHRENIKKAIEKGDVGVIVGELQKYVEMGFLDVLSEENKSLDDLFEHISPVRASAALANAVIANLKESAAATDSVIHSKNVSELQYAFSSLVMVNREQRIGADLENGVPGARSGTLLAAGTGIGKARTGVHIAANIMLSTSQQRAAFVTNNTGSLYDDGLQQYIEYMAGVEKSKRPNMRFVTPVFVQGKKGDGKVMLAVPKAIKEKGWDYFFDDPDRMSEINFNSKVNLPLEETEGERTILLMGHGQLTNRMSPVDKESMVWAEWTHNHLGGAGSQALIFVDEAHNINAGRPADLTAPPAYVYNPEGMTNSEMLIRVLGDMHPRRNTPDEKATVDVGYLLSNYAKHGQDMVQSMASRMLQFSMPHATFVYSSATPAAGIEDYFSYTRLPIYETGLKNPVQFSQMFRGVGIHSGNPKKEDPEDRNLKHEKLFYEANASDTSISIGAKVPSEVGASFLASYLARQGALIQVELATNAEIQSEEFPLKEEALKNTITAIDKMAIMLNKVYDGVAPEQRSAVSNLLREMYGYVAAATTGAELIESAKKDIANGEQVVINVYNIFEEAEKLAQEGGDKSAIGAHLRKHAQEWELEDSLKEEVKKIINEIEALLPKSLYGQMIDEFGKDGFANISGLTTAARRTKDKNRFQAGEVKAVLLSGAGGTGISLHDLNGARRILYMAQYPNQTEMLVQSQGRIDRSGQKSDPFVRIPLHKYLPYTNRDYMAVRQKFRKMRASITAKDRDADYIEELAADTDTVFAQRATNTAWKTLYDRENHEELRKNVAPIDRGENEDEQDPWVRYVNSMQASIMNPQDSFGNPKDPTADDYFKAMGYAPYDLQQVMWGLFVETHRQILADAIEQGMNIQRGSLRFSDTVLVDARTLEDSGLVYVKLRGKEPVGKTDFARAANAVINFSPSAKSMALRVKMKRKGDRTAKQYIYLWSGEPDSESYSDRAIYTEPFSRAPARNPDNVSTPSTDSEVEYFNAKTGKWQKVDSEYVRSDLNDTARSIYRQAPESSTMHTSELIGEGIAPLRQAWEQQLEKTPPPEEWVTQNLIMGDIFGNISRVADLRDGAPVSGETRLLTDGDEQVKVGFSNAVRASISEGTFRYGGLGGDKGFMPISKLTPNYLLNTIYAASRPQVKIVLGTDDWGFQIRFQVGTDMYNIVPDNSDLLSINDNNNELTDALSLKSKDSLDKYGLSPANVNDPSLDELVISSADFIKKLWPRIQEVAATKEDAEMDFYSYAQTSAPGIALLEDFDSPASEDNRDYAMLGVPPKPLTSGLTGMAARYRFDEQAFLKEALAIAKRINPDIKGVEFADRIFSKKRMGAGEAAQEAAGYYDRDTQIVRLSRNIAQFDPNWVLHHEIFHAVQHTLLTDKEHTMLEEAYPARDGLSSIERQANAFADYVQGHERRASMERGVRMAFSKLLMFFRRIGAMFKRLKLAVPDDIFSAVHSGELAHRSAVAYYNGDRDKAMAAIKRSAVPQEAYFLMPKNKSRAGIRDWVQDTLERSRAATWFDTMLVKMTAGKYNIEKFRRDFIDKFAAIRDFSPAAWDIADGMFNRINWFVRRFESTTYREVYSAMQELASKHGWTMGDTEEYITMLSSAQRDKLAVEQGRIEAKSELDFGGFNRKEMKAKMAAYKAKLEADPKAKALFDKMVKAITKANRFMVDTMHTSQMIDENTAGEWKHNHPLYLPFVENEFKDEESEFGDAAGYSPFMATGGGFKVFRFMQARGRRDPPVNTIVQWFQFLQHQVRQAERNKVLARLALDLHEMVKRGDTTTKALGVKLHISGRVVFKGEGGGEKKFGRSTKARANDFFVYIDGKASLLEVRNEPLNRALRAGAYDELNIVMRMFGRVTGFLAATRTTFSVNFLGGAVPRDLEQVALRILSDLYPYEQRESGETASLMADLTKNTGFFFRHIRSGSRAFTRPDLSSPEEHKPDSPEFWIETAGEWGVYSHLWTSIGGDFKRYMDSLAGTLKEEQGVTNKAFAPVRNAIQWWERNAQFLEAIPRLAAFKTMVDRGIDVRTAASIAREATINFSRRGEVTRSVIAPLYMFANPIIREIVIQVGNLRRKSGRRVIYGIILFGFFMSALNHLTSMDEEDEADKYAAKGADAHALDMFFPTTFGYFKLPVAYGYNVFYKLGHNIGDLVFSDMFTPAEAAMDVALLAANNYNPTGGLNWNTTLVPTLARPAIELALNEDPWGRTIYPKENPFKTQKDYQQYYAKQTMDALEDMTKFMAEIVKDDKGIPAGPDVSPATIQYLTEQALPGPIRFAERVSKTAEAMFTSKPVEARNIPLIRRFLSTTQSSYWWRNKFYDSLAEANRVNDHYNDIKDKKQKVAFYRNNRYTIQIAKRRSKLLDEWKRTRTQYDDENQDKWLRGQVQKMLRAMKTDEERRQ